MSTNEKKFVTSEQKDMFCHCLTVGQGCATFMAVSFTALSVRDIISETFYMLDVQLSGLVFFSFFLGLHTF